MNFVVLISGRGSNLGAIIQAIAKGGIDANLVAVISPKSAVAGLQYAIDNSIPTFSLDHMIGADKTAYDKELARIIGRFDAELIVLAGFMRVLGSEFIHQYAGRIINVHPSLLPKYKGLNTHRRVLAAQDRVHGVSVHFVTEKLDGGSIIAYAKVAVHAGETESSLSARVLVQEHRIYPVVIQWFVSKIISLKGDRVVYNNQLLPYCGIEL